MGRQGQMMTGIGDFYKCWVGTIVFVFQNSPLLAKRIDIRTWGGKWGMAETRIVRSVVGVQITDDKNPVLERQHDIVGFNLNSSLCCICNFG